MGDERSGAGIAPARATKSRLVILALICLRRRLITPIARSWAWRRQPLTAELEISPAVMGIVFSAFSWTYAAAQIPGGILLDRLGTRVTYTVSLILWSVFTLMHGLAFGVVALIIFRLGLGHCRSPMFSNQQPSTGNVVSAKRACTRQWRLLRRPVFWAGLSEPAPFLDRRDLGLALAVRFVRRDRDRLRHHLVFSLSRPRRQPFSK